jgi:hypothetical protein
VADRCPSCGCAGRTETCLGLVCAGCGRLLRSKPTGRPAQARIRRLDLQTLASFLAAVALVDLIVLDWLWRWGLWR